MDIANEQWERLASLLPDSPKGPRGQDKPVRNALCAILNGILCILRTGASWKDSPERYPPVPDLPQMVPAPAKEGVFGAGLLALADDLRELGELNLRKAFIDMAFAPDQKGLRVGKTKRGGGAKIMAAADAAGFPLALHAASAPPHEAALVEETL